MPPLTDHKLQRILTRFPWRRRKPRSDQRGKRPIGMVTREGQQLWADAHDLAAFEDPGPALVCAAMRGDQSSHDLLRSLVHHHAQARGIVLPTDIPGVTTRGLEILGNLIECAGLDPGEPIGPHLLGDLLTATWAIAAATGAGPRAEA